MSEINMPVGRVFSTSARDFNRAIIRGAAGGPARPTKTVAPPSMFMAPGSFAASFAAFAEGGDTGQDAEAATADVMPLVGGWSLTTDGNGSLIALHEDGSRQLLAARTVPAPEKDTNDG